MMACCGNRKFTIYTNDVWTCNAPRNDMFQLCRSIMIAQWTSGQQVEQSILRMGVIHIKYHLISQGCFSIALQYRIVALNITH